MHLTSKAMLFFFFFNATKAMADAIIAQVYSNGHIMARYVLDLSFSVKGLCNIFL